MPTQTELAESPHWPEREQGSSFFDLPFPFDEGFPSQSIGKTYTLITRNGTRHQHATVDLSTQYRAEGLNWRSVNGQIIYPWIVVAWKQEILNPMQ